MKCVRGKWEKAREKPSQIQFRPPRNPHGVIETRTMGPNGGGRAINRLMIMFQVYINITMFAVVK